MGDEDISEKLDELAGFLGTTLEEILKVVVVRGLEKGGEILSEWLSYYLEDDN